MKNNKKIKEYNINFLKKNHNSHQLKRGYALNLSILVSAAQKKKTTVISSVTASEVEKTENKYILICLY